MKLLTLLGKIALGGIVAVAGFTVVGKIRQAQASSPAAKTAAAKGGQLSPAGFFLLNPEETKNPRVVIMTPPNCPSEDAQRARALADSLGQAGVPVETRSEIAVTFTDPADAERVNRHMNGAGMPLVIVRGWAKGAPTYDQVLAQYNLKP